MFAVVKRGTPFEKNYLLASWKFGNVRVLEYADFSRRWARILCLILSRELKIESLFPVLRTINSVIAFIKVSKVLRWLCQRKKNLRLFCARNLRSSAWNSLLVLNLTEGIHVIRRAAASNLFPADFRWFLTQMGADFRSHFIEGIEDWIFFLLLRTINSVTVFIKASKVLRWLCQRKKNLRLFCARNLRSSAWNSLLVLNLTEGIHVIRRVVASNLFPADFRWFLTQKSTDFILYLLTLPPCESPSIFSYFSQHLPLQEN